MMMCSRCRRRPAVMFISKVSGSRRTNEGICINCAKEIGLPQLNDVLDKMNISDDDFDEVIESIFEGNNGTNNNDDSLNPFDADTENTPTKEEDDFFEHGRANMAPNFLRDTFKADTESAPPKETRSTKKSRKAHKVLDTYCTNLTLKAKEGKIDNIVGRDNEISRVIQILSRRTKNNPCLIGEPGVGKTAIAEGIALKIAKDDVPFRLKDKEIYLLDLTSLVAGTQFRGQFESRIKSLVEEVVDAGNIILFIDELHTLVGAGGHADDSMNAANMFKPALSRGEMQIIGATTFTEYRQYIEKDGALERRFQPVTVNEPSIEDTVAILNGIKQYYEDYHKVHVSDDVVKMCAVLSERYINDRFLPDKAIDLLDEACARASLNSSAIAKYEELKKELEVQKLEESEFTKNSSTDYNYFDELQTNIAKNEKRLNKLKTAAKNVFVSIDDVTNVIEVWTGIPASKIQETDFKRMAALEDNLKAKVIGQNEACELVAKAVKRSRIQLSDRRRPASFIFVGPTGVGKTELAKVLAKEMFSSIDPLIRLDMSEYMEPHSVSKIIGSPPGYVGYDEAGQLTEKIRRQPYSVILFDEIEKAHPDVMNILLQILDEGRITDSHGRTINFENTIIIMTSNAGSSTGANGIGFAKSVEDISRERTMKSLREFLRPEFIGRVDEVVAFAPLSEESYAKIAKLNLEDLYAPLKEKGLTFKISDSVYAVIAKKAYGSKYSGRDIRRVIRSEIEDKITEQLIDNCEKILTEVSVTVKNDEIIVTVKE